MTPWTWVILSCIWACCIVAWVIVFRRIKKIRARTRELREQMAATRLAQQEQEYERRRREMYRLNREHQILMREMRGEPAVPQVTQEQWEQSKKKARACLLSMLNEQQAKDFKTHNWFDVEAKGSGNLYRIFGGSYVGNVHVMKGFGYEASAYPPEMIAEDPYLVVRNSPRFCAHLYNYGEDYPTEDHLLAQMLMLRNQESQFLTIAHRMN
jgi:predicted Holliday junction resolvase-like endonuclease